MGHGRPEQGHRPLSRHRDARPVGNFSVAGHRKTHGEPFRHLDEMRAGDLVYVETAQAWYTYRIDADPVIVPPSDVGGPWPRFPAGVSSP